MRYEDQEPYSFYTEEQPQSSQEKDSATEPYYAESRRSTPMGAPRRVRRRGGIMVGILIVALLAGAAFSTAQLLRRVEVKLDETDDGFSFSVQKKAASKETLSAREEASAAPDTQKTEPSAVTQPAQDAVSTPEAQPPAQSSDQNPEHTNASLEVQPSPTGADTIISAAPEALSLQEIYEKLIPSVVSIVSTLQSGSATGTGIIMSSSGYIITNHHVIEDAVQLTVLTWDDAQYPATLVGSDAISDLAVLKIEAETLTAAEFGDSDALRVGDSVVAIGDPLGTQLRGTMTNGIVSAINRDLTVEDRKMTLIQTNAALNSGNSGGPLINCYGQVIGINTMKMSSYYSSASVEGLGFAIPIAVAKPIVDELIENGYVSGRPAIGINGEAMPEYARLYYRLPKGVYLTYVSESSDAWQKGLREGDILTAVNGTEVSSIDDVNTIKNQFSAGDTITLTVYRSGKYYEVPVVLMDQALQ